MELTAWRYVLKHCPIKGAQFIRVRWLRRLNDGRHARQTSHPWRPRRGYVLKSRVLSNDRKWTIWRISWTDRNRFGRPVLFHRDRDEDVAKGLDIRQEKSYRVLRPKQAPSLFRIEPIPDTNG